MVFSSQSFLFYFVPIVLVAYALVPARGRNWLLLLASLLFYTWGAGEFVGILGLSIAGNWGLGRFGGRAAEQGDVAAKRLCITLSVILNLGILGWFKYANFFVAQIDAMATAWFGPTAAIEWSQIALPIGVSFFTFQAMSYVIDVSLGRAKAVERPGDFALYVALFPQLIAGPIVRYREIAEQLRERSFALEGVSRGGLRFAHGLVKKVVVADTVSVIADAAFAPGAELSFADAWIGVLAYGVQIYFDFSGYSDMAIGLGTMFGFRLPENFRRPYSCVSITDFWRRWHITLSAWFRDYLFVFLGGSRPSPARVYVNLFIVFLLTGLWHGAAWTYAIFGIYHGAILIVERMRGQREPRDPGRRALRRVLATFLFSMGWPIFRAGSIGQTLDYYGALFDLSHLGFTQAISASFTTQGVVVLALASLIHVMPGRRCMGVYLLESQTRPAALCRLGLALVGLPLALALVISGSFSPFLYFQF